MDGGLERFTPVRRVDAAGTAELWLATDEDGEQVALTLLEPGSATDPARAEWVATAADAGGRLTGPHLVPIREHGTDGGRLYVCREWVAGDDLAGRRPHPDLHAADAVATVEQVAAALDTAWEVAGLVHGDLRAGHVVVAGAAGPRVTLVGFEWARLAGLGPRPGAAGAHLAPERFAGRPASRAGDVYSLACLLHELLAGSPPFDEGRPPPGGRTVPSVGGPARAPWDRVLRRGLAEDPGARPGTGAELARAARAALDDWRRVARGPGPVPGPTPAPGGPASAEPATDEPGTGDDGDDGTPPRTATGDPAAAVPSAATATAGTATGADERNGPSARPTGPAPRHGDDTTRDRTARGHTAGDPATRDRTAGGRTPRDHATGAGRGTRTGAREPGPGPDSARPPWGTDLPDPARPGPSGRRPRWTSATGPARRRPIAGIAAGVLATAAAGVAIAVLTPTPAEAGPTVVLGGDPVAVATSPDPRTVLVSDATGSVGVVDLPSRTVVARVPVGEQPAGIAVERYGRHAYVANSGAGTVSVVDVAARTVVDTVPVGDTPVAVTVRADGARAYVANQESADITVIDTADRSVVTTVPVGFLPWKTVEGIAVSRDGTRAVVTLDSGFGTDTLQVVDLERGEVTGAVPVGRSPLGVAISPDGRRAWVADSDDGTVSAVDLLAGTRSRTIDVGGSPSMVLLGPGGRAWVPAAADGTVAALDLATATRAPDPAPEVGAVAMSVGVGGRTLHLLGADGVLTTVAVR